MSSSVNSLFRRKKRRTKRTDIFLENNHVSLIHAGTEFFTALKKMIDEAKHLIHLQTYILADDETGQFIAKALIEAAKRKVAVYLLADGYASQKLSKEYQESLREAGIKFRFFEPLMKSKYFYFGRRLHHKVVVADGAKALVGSMNIADRYNDLPGARAWLDMALYIEGEACEMLHTICWNVWGKRRSPSIELPASAKTDKHNGIPARIRRNDWVRGKQEIFNTHMALFRLAEKKITIVCSYFLPGRLFRYLLKKAARRGVNVTVVLAKTSDVKVAKDAERYLYRWLLRNNIRVFEYRPTILHAKFMVVDEHYVTLGSYNLNELSAYASVELNVDVKHEGFAREVQKEIDTMIENDCESMDLTVYNTRFFSVRQFVQWSSYIFLRLLLLVSTFYYKQRE